MKIDIYVNPYNPAEYLSCCGVFEILARYDKTATAYWQFEPKTCFRLDSILAESDLLLCISTTLTNWRLWNKEINKSVNLSEYIETENDCINDEPEEESQNEAVNNESLRITPTFYLNSQKETFTLDWWYETLTPDLEIKDKSGWKFYAGKQVVQNIFRDMTVEAARLLKEHQVETFSDRLKLSAGMTGRFGFDPRSSRNALDAGFSANDLNWLISTYPFVELLANIAIQNFFPHRTHQSAGITSSRGWIEEDVFQFALWKRALPIALARVAAVGAILTTDDLVWFRAGRARRDRYSNFKMATTNMYV